MTTYAVGTSKDELALAAALAHPGVTPVSVLEYAPSLAPVARAAAVLDMLADAGKLERRAGLELFEYFPVVGVKAPEIAVVVNPSDPDDALDLRAALLKAIGEHPGLTSTGLLEHVPGYGSIVALGRAVCELMREGLVERSRDKGNHKFHYLKGAKPPPHPRQKSNMARPRHGERQIDRVVQTVLLKPGHSGFEIHALLDPPLPINKVHALLMTACLDKMLSRSRQRGVFCYWGPGEAPPDDDVPALRQPTAGSIEAQRVAASAQRMKLEADIRAACDHALARVRASAPKPPRAEAQFGDFGVDVEELERLVVPRPSAPVLGEPQTVIELRRFADGRLLSLLVAATGAAP